MNRRTWYLPTRPQDAGAISTAAVDEGDGVVIIVNAMTIVARLTPAQCREFAEWLRVAAGAR
jgi:hypothetical protein